MKFYVNDVDKTHLIDLYTSENCDFSRKFPKSYNLIIKALGKIENSEFDHCVAVDYSVARKDCTAVCVCHVVDGVAYIDFADTVCEEGLE